MKLKSKGLRVHPKYMLLAELTLLQHGNVVDRKVIVVPRRATAFAVSLAAKRAMGLTNKPMRRDMPAPDYRRLRATDGTTLRIELREPEPHESIADYDATQLR